MNLPEGSCVFSSSPAKLKFGDRDDASGLKFATTLGETALRTLYYKALSSLCPPLEGKLSDKEQDVINS